MRALLSCAAMLVTGMPCVAQATPPTVQNAMVWGAIFGDHRIAAKTAIYWDYQPRRAEAGRVWQINLGSVGLTRDLSPQWRITTALGWSYGYRYGEFSPPNNVAEVRPWMQLTGIRRAGAYTWSDRTRAELRLLRPAGEFAPADADWGPSVVRLRRMDRVQRPLAQDGRIYGAIQQEFLVNVHPARARVAALEQSRSQFLIGRQLSPVNRIEAGYGLQYWNRRGGNEMNHTLLVYWRTFVPFR